MTSRDEEHAALEEELARLRAEHARLEAEAAALRRSTDPAAQKRRALALACVVLPLAAIAAYAVYRVFFRWFG